MSGGKYIVFDCETTGLLKPGPVPLADQPKIIEFGLAVIEGDAVANEASWLINPGEEITAEITKITGIDNDAMLGSKPFSFYLPQITEFFIGARGMIAHNLPFDKGMLLNELRRINKESFFPYPPNQICTVAAFNHLKGRRMKLPELYEHFTKKPLKQDHRALADVRALCEIVLNSEMLKDA